MAALRTQKNPLDSKGILGGIFGTASAVLIAWMLSRFLGMEVSASDVVALQEGFPEILATGRDLWELISLSGVALCSAVVALMGNWVRQFKVGWSGQVAKRPWRSKGVLGGVLAFVSAGLIALKTFVLAMAADGPEILETLDAAETFVLGFEEILLAGVAAVTAALGGLLSMWGRWRAQSRVTSGMGTGGEDLPEIHISSIRV